VKGNDARKKLVGRTLVDSVKRPESAKLSVLGTFDGVFEEGGMIVCGLRFKLHRVKLLCKYEHIHVINASHEYL
jgi:hypothetical protein